MTFDLAIRNGLICNADGDCRISDIGISEGRINAIGNTIKAKSELDASNKRIVPGFIDIHTHGIGFESVKDGDIAEISRIEASYGATSFVPTLFGPPDESIENLCRHLKATDNLQASPQIAGFRLESPYLGYTGAGIPTDLAPVSRKLTDSILQAGDGHILIWDISPEIDGACNEIDYLSSKGIICSLAHTRASIEQAKDAVDAGAKLVTHLFDTFVVPTMTDPGVYPVSLIDYLLVEDRLHCEIIGDGAHVHPLLVEKTFRCKGLDKTVFVTDSNLGAGLPDGDYELPGGWGRARVSGTNNGVRLIDREMGLAGSALTPIGSFVNAVQIFKRRIADACRLCSLVPANLLGLNKGVIAEGFDADLVLLNEDLAIEHTISAGQIVYSNF